MAAKGPGLGNCVFDRLGPIVPVADDLPAQLAVGAKHPYGGLGSALRPLELTVGPIRAAPRIRAGLFGSSFPCHTKYFPLGAES